MVEFWNKAKQSNAIRKPVGHPDIIETDRNMFLK